MILENFLNSYLKDKKTVGFYTELYSILILKKMIDKKKCC